MTNKTYRFEAVCPRCHKVSEVFSAVPAPAPQANCSDCLMDDVEIVTLRLTLKPEQES